METVEPTSVAPNDPDWYATFQQLGEEGYEQVKRGYEQAEEQAKKVPWWGWLLIILGIIAVLAVIIWAIAYSVEQQRTWGCVAGEGCKQGEGNMSETQCRERCADEGAIVYRCKEDGNCTEVGQGEGIPSAESCQDDCRQAFQLMVPVSNVSDDDNANVILSAQGLCQYGNEIYLGLRAPEEGYRLHLPGAPRTGGLVGNGDDDDEDGNGGNGTGEPLPLETAMTLVRYFDDAPFETWGNLTLKAPQETLDTLKQKNPGLASVSDDDLAGYMQWALTSGGNGSGLTFTLTQVEGGNTDPPQVHISATMGDEVYYLYALEGTENACEYFPIFALPIDPTDPPENISKDLLSRSVFTLDTTA